MAKKYQTGGKIATTKKEQRKGLNDQSYDQMHFPVLDNPVRQFRGLDSYEPVAVIDQLGRQQVLYGPQDMATTYGPVYEQRRNSWAPSWGQQMQTGGYAPRQDVPKEMIDPSGRSHYDPYTGKMYLTPEQYDNPDVYNHESFHEYQDRMGRLSVPELWEGPLKQPSIVNTDDIKGAYYNRQGLDANIIGNEFIRRYPEAQFLPNNITHRYKDPRNAPPDKVFERFIDPIRYSQPWTVEGEADQYEHENHNGNYNSIVDRVMSNNRTYQTGGVAPFVTSDPVEYQRRKQAYDDSDLLYRKGQENVHNLQSAKNADEYISHQDPYSFPDAKAAMLRLTQYNNKPFTGAGVVHRKFNFFDNGEAEYTAQPQQPVVYQPQQQPQKPVDKPKPRPKTQIQSLPISDPKLLPVDRQEPQPEQININNLNPNEEQWLSPQTNPFRPAGFYKQGMIPGQGWVPSRQYGGSQNTTDMAKKQQGYSIPGYKWGGNKLGGAAIVLDTNPYGSGAANVPVQYQRAQNGMMQMGGSYLTFMSDNPALPNMNMQHGGPTTNYDPVNWDNSSVQFINDKRGTSQMQTPGRHWTNDGYKKTTGSNMNGNSWSKFGGNISGGLPAPLEYAYLQDGGYLDQYHTGGQMADGGFAANGPMIVDATPDEMKHGGIHIKKENVGKFTAYKKRTGKTTEEALHSPDPHVRQMANFARNAKKWAHKEFGGEVSGKLSKFIKQYHTGGETNFDAPLTNTSADQQDKEGFPQDSSAMGNAWGSSQSKDIFGDQGPSADMSQTNPDPYADSRAQKYDNNLPNASPDSPVGPGANPDYATDEEMTNYNPSSNNGGQGASLPRNNFAQRQAAGQAGRNLLGAGMQAASYFEDQAKQRNMQGFNRSLGQSDQAFAAQKLNTTGNKGDYNQAGNFRPNQNTPYMPGITYPQAQWGGYQTGGVVELPDHEINRLRSLGYKVEYI
jgi:hypothetical protein